MSAQLALDLSDAEMNRPDPYDLIRKADAIVVFSSGGKDSQAMLDFIAEHAAAAGVSKRVTVVHHDLGTTDSGLPVEWPGVADLARQQAAHYGFRFEITRRERGGLFQQLRNERRKWPSARMRWCTSDQKTSQGLKFVTGLVAELRARLRHPTRPMQILYCLGLRAEESSGRARKPAVSFDEAHSNSRRTITRFLPIHHWSTRDVWDRIEASGVPHHKAYDLGMSRLSCSLCVLSSRADLVLAARLRPDLAREYAELEAELGHDFRVGLSMADIIAAAGTSDGGLGMNPDHGRQGGTA